MRRATSDAGLNFELLGFGNYDRNVYRPPLLFRSSDRLRSHPLAGSLGSRVLNFNEWPIGFCLWTCVG